MEAATENPSICIGCGLCCDGTLHGYTRVSESDEEGAAAIDLIVDEEDGKRIFRQPCPQFSCGRCKVYSKRPPVCRTYRCALLKRVDAGSITAGEARQRVVTARKLVSALIAAAPDASTPARRSQLARQLRSELSSLSGEQRARAAKMILDLASLDHHLTRWFRKSPIKP